MELGGQNRHGHRVIIKHIPQNIESRRGAITRMDDIATDAGSNSAPARKLAEASR
jgi:hypothetical protein